LQIGDERFCLASKMVEIRAGRKLLFHDSSPWLRRDPQTGDTKNVLGIAETWELEVGLNPSRGSGGLLLAVMRLYIAHSMAPASNGRAEGNDGFPLRG
jgi:hypothetical protein